MAFSDQRPRRSGFGATSGSGDVLAGIDLAGKTVIVASGFSGLGYSGLGLETTRALVAHGVRLVVPARSPGWAETALSSMAHRNSDLRWDDIHYRTEPNDKWQAYGQSRTSNALFANVL